MKLIAEHYYECVSPPMPSFTKGKDYQVFSDEFGNLVVYPDESAKVSGPFTASVWIDGKHFRDVTDKYEADNGGMGGFSHTYKIVFIESKSGHTIGSQKVYEVTAGSKEQALDSFWASREAGYRYQIQYWES